MTIIKLETTSKVVELKTTQTIKDLGTYWVTIEYRYKTNRKKYVSLYYTKKQAYIIFIKLCNSLLAQKYIHY